MEKLEKPVGISNRLIIYPKEEREEDSVKIEIFDLSEWHRENKQSPGGKNSVILTLKYKRVSEKKLGDI
ncbi:MAG: hypothetical protein ACE5J0_03225 [Candidatus Paceibacterales bacterium]